MKGNIGITSLALIILPAGTTADDAKLIFNAALEKIQQTAVADSTGFMSLLNAQDILGRAAIIPVNPTIVTLADNLVAHFGSQLNDQLTFLTSFFSEYYGPRDIVNHQIVTLLAEVKENTPEWSYLSEKGLSFLVLQCRKLLSNTSY